MADQTGASGSSAGGDCLGVVMLDTTFPRPPGDVGNARSYDYPVAFAVAEGAGPVDVVREQEVAIEPFADAARTLVDRGAVAITTSCGFLLSHQDLLSERVPEVPVFTSSLLQIPVVASMLAPDERIGVISADEQALDRLDHPVLDEYADRLVVGGLSDGDSFQATIVEESAPTLDREAVGEEVVAAAEAVVDRGHVGALLFECTNLRPYVDEVRAGTGLPVFDYLTFADMAWRAGRGTRQ